MYFSAIEFIIWTIFATSDLGTVASSSIVVGLRRASADSAVRLAAVKAAASSSVAATWTENAPSCLQMAMIFSMSRFTASGEPSCSIKRMALHQPVSLFSHNPQQQLPSFDQETQG